MLNIIKADIYRIIHGKAIYITFAILLALTILTCFSTNDLTIGVQMDELEKSLGDNNEILVYNGMNIAKVLYTSIDNLVWFILSLLIAVAGPMFSHGTIKNSISCGVSRIKLYFSKLILSGILCLVAMLLYMASGILVATILRGFGTPPNGYLINLLKICSAQLFLIFAINCFGIFLVFTTKRTAMVNGFFIAFFFVPIIIILMLSNISEEFIKLYDYDLIGNLKKFGYLNALQFIDIIKGLALGAFYIIATTFSGIMLFRKSEIK